MADQLTVCLIPQASVCASFKVCTDSSNLLSVSGSGSHESRKVDTETVFMNTVEMEASLRLLADDTVVADNEFNNTS
jgi:hypothetical protein